MAGAWKRGQFGQGAAKWQQAYAASGANIKAGVAAPSKDPTQAAIAAKDSMVAGFNAAVTNGTWQANLQKSGLAGWQSGMNTFATNGLQAAATKGAPHVAAYANAVGPQVMAQVASLPARGPAGTNQQRSAQLNQWQHSNRGKNRAAWRGTSS